MAKPTPRADLVKMLSAATVIVAEAIPLPEDEDVPEIWRQEGLALRAAALPVILRELLDYEVE